MRNIVILNSLHFSYPLPILMRVSYNTLIVKQNTSDYYKYTNFRQIRIAEKPSFRLPIKNTPIHLFAENNLCTFTEASKRDKGDA